MAERSRAAISIPPAPDLSFEAQLWQSGAQFIAGIDEAGRGALAGPVTAAAIIFLPEPSLDQKLVGVCDSKQMTPAERSAWAQRLPGIALDWAVGFAEAEEIDALGIVPATRLAVSRALHRLSTQPDHLLVDYLKLPGENIPQTSLIKGDARSLSIAAASILAKTSRDGLCRDLEKVYPGYGFAKHKGYGTQFHLDALARMGPSPVHRRSFKPVAVSLIAARSRIPPQNPSKSPAPSWEHES
jgi:ribonuclease HII